MRKSKKIFIFFVLFFVIFLPHKALAIDVSAKYACVIDALSGKVLFEKNAYKSHSMASTTKIMTAHVALKNSSPTDIVTVSKNASGVEGSSIYLKQGEKIKMEDLLYGLMLASGNDAAVAIAEHISGSVDAFADLMNEEAKRIGVKNTGFKNPNGLDAEGHFTTAYDLAQITREAMKNPLFCEIVKTKSRELKNSDVGYSRYVTNHNKMLKLYPGCTGVKTGFTKKTGRCLVTSCTRDNMSIIAVTLSAPDDWNDHTKMLDFAFNNSEAVPFIKKDMVLKTVPVISGSSPDLEIIPNEDFYILKEKGKSTSGYSLSYNLPDEIPAPIDSGTVVGFMSVMYGEEELKKIELIAKDTIEYVVPPKPDFWEILYRLFIPYGG